jgi:hypothetical protein
VSAQGTGGDMSSIAAKAETPSPNTAIKPAANATWWDVLFMCDSF